jgi:hypothetical protein
MFLTEKGVRMTRIALGFIWFLILATSAIANTPQAPFHLGRIWLNPEFDGAEGWSGSALQYPGGIPREGAAGDSNEVCRGWIGQGQKWGTYLFSTDWTDPDGWTWEHAISCAFRSYDYSYPTVYTEPGYKQPLFVFAVGMQEYLRFERPVISIQTVSDITQADTMVTIQMHPGSAGWNSIHTSLPDHDGVGPLPDPIVNPGLVTEETIESVWRYGQGVELKRRMYGYPYGSPHQDYVLQDITLTNNGISGNIPEAPVFTDQSLTNVVWAQAYDYRNMQAPTSTQTGKDADGMYVEPWGVGNHSAVLFSDGDDPVAPGPDWGDPIEDPFYQAQMASTAHILIGPLFVSAGSGAEYATDDLAQPAFRMMYYERGIDIPDGKIEWLQTSTSQRDLLTRGIFQLPLNTDYKDFTPTAAIVDEDPGPTAVIGYGPLDGGEITETNWADHGWDIPFGESVRIVQMVAAGGLDQEEARRIGKTWVENRVGEIPADQWMSQTDQWLVKSGRDTVMKAAALAQWNFNGALPSHITSEDKPHLNLTDVIDPKPAGHFKFDVPDAPRPPGYVGVYVDDRKHIIVRWTREPETTRDHDTGVHDVIGYHVWMQKESRNAPWQLIADGIRYWFANLPAEGSMPMGPYLQISDYEEGVPYWFAVTAYDDGTQDWGSYPPKSLESSRWWTWTGYDPTGLIVRDRTDVAVASPTQRTALLPNTPNPFNPVTTIRFTLTQATPVKLVVYNMAGQRVRTLIDGARYAGSHNIVWDGKDAMGRNCASGVYVSQLITPKTTDVRKLTIIR